MEKVNWDWKPSRGYGAFHSVAGLVIKRTEKRVKIAVFNLRTKQVEETYVKPESLSQRTNVCEIDQAMGGSDETC